MSASWSSDEIRTECDAWQRGRRFPVDDHRLDQLAAVIRDDVETWWGVLRDLALASSAEDEIGNLSYLLAAAVTAVPGLDERLRDAALTDHRLVCLLAHAIDRALLGDDDNVGCRILDLFGDVRVADAYLRYQRTHDEIDFWAYSVIHDTIASDPERAWILVLRLIAGAPEDDILGVVAAGPLEDFVATHGVAFVDRIVAAAGEDDRFAAALRGTWVWDDLPSTVFERIARAAGSPLDRPRTIEEASQRRASNRRLRELSERVLELALSPEPADVAETKTLLAELGRRVGLDY